MVVAVAVPEMADDGLEDRAVEGGRSGIGRGVRLAARGTAVCSSEATGIFFPLGPGPRARSYSFLAHFLPMIGAA